ncbi:MAG: class I SAM-dependent methyltransferase [Nitrospira sp.]|nr:class I SAM-dependent methyltransferase [Nitrospira sp.]
MDQRLTKTRYGFWEIGDKPTPQELQQYYSKKYYQEGKGGALEYSKDEMLHIQGKLEEYWHVLQKCLLPSAGTRSLLDVGCGEGHALSFFRSRGWSVKGLDFSIAGVQSKHPECLDHLVVGDIYESLREELAAGKVYDVVWLENVLEHVLDPIDLLQALHRLVAVNGMAVVSVPNDCSITQLAAMTHGHIDNAFWVSPPDHLNYFDHDSLVNTAQITGWGCEEILANFPIDWFLFHHGSNYVRDKSVGKAAHKARIQIENLIHERPVEDGVRFWSALARLGFGRNLAAFLRPSDENRVGPIPRLEK